jgi:hypothetical protein
MSEGHRTSGGSAYARMLQNKAPVDKCEDVPHDGHVLQVQHISCALLVSLPQARKSACYRPIAQDLQRSDLDRRRTEP